jgi:hypothetical protein
MPNRGRTTRSQPSAAPWWLSGGEEECPHCGHLYVHEVEIRCFDCDAPGCPHCIVRHRERNLCPDCGPSVRKQAAGEKR